MPSIPVQGYPSKTAAIWAMLDEGKSYTEIARLCDTTEQTVLAQVSAKRAKERRYLNPDLRSKAQRIYLAALRVIGEAINVEPETLHGVYSRMLFKDFLALEEIEKRQAAEGLRELASVADDVATTEEYLEDMERLEKARPPISTTPAIALRSLATKAPEPPPKALPPPEPVPPRPVRVTTSTDLAGAKLVTLYDPDTGVYLNLDGTGVTRDRQYIYRGTRQQAAIMRDRSPVARTMILKPFAGPQR